MNYRSMSIRLNQEGRPLSLDEEQRSVECIMATETPVRMYDYNRHGYIDEVLLMSGVQIPTSRQVPFLDTHSRYDTSSVIGSTRGIRVDGDQLVGRDFFSSVPEAVSQWTKTMEGHLTDRSIGYTYNNSDAVYVNDGNTAVVDGRTFTGPVKVVKKWSVRENSICPIGADEIAKARANQPVINKQEKKQMNKKLRAYLESNGLPATATDEEADAFFASFKMPERTAAVDLDKERADAAMVERERCSEIRIVAGKFDQESLGEKLITEGRAIDEARKAIMDAHIEVKMKEETPGHRSPIQVGIDARDKFRAAGTDAILTRAGLAPEKPAAGHDELSGYSLRELARKALQVEGKRESGSALEMIGRALTTTDFPYLLANTANKSLFAGWEGAQETWKTWCATGSVSDFKTQYLPRVSETSDLDEIPEGMEYKYGARTEAQESFSIATYGKMLAITRQSIINDDLSALTDIPRSHGEAAARKVGDLPYAVLTANANMGDGSALFSTTHSNYVASGSGAIPGVSTIAAGILAMGTQKDLLGKRRLNIRPVYFLAPKALEGAAEVFFRTDRFSDHSTVATDSSFASTRVNPYAGTVLERVYDARLDDDDAAAWYLAANKGRTITVFFLDGKQAPYMDMRNGWSVDGVEYKVRIDAGAKAVDWKGLYYNDGN